MAAADFGATAECAVFVLQYPDHPFLSRSDRDALWEKFQVPVFALLLDRQGRLTAWECEAQEGLHVGGAWTGEALWVYRLLASGPSLPAPSLGTRSLKRATVYVTINLARGWC